MKENTKKIIIFIGLSILGGYVIFGINLAQYVH